MFFFFVHAKEAGMLIETLDKTQWQLPQAIDHIMNQLQHRAAKEASGVKPMAGVPAWQQPQNPREAAISQAGKEIQIALRDGDLLARGRLSTTQALPWSHELGGWDLHSGHHSTISPEQWLSGRANMMRGNLTMVDGQFIDIRVPRFMILAIWPVIEPPELPTATDPATGKPYKTPYMDLLDRAIRELKITQRDQCKKELIADWFRQQSIEGEQLSQNLADAMATLIRLPSSQRGGAKRGF